VRRVVVMEGRGAAESAMLVAGSVATVVKVMGVAEREGVVEATEVAEWEAEVRALAVVERVVEEVTARAMVMAVAAAVVVV
jgi:hypothetical protein